jgi:hypothetical protein
VFFVNAFLSQEFGHLILIDPAITILIDLAELMAQLSNFFCVLVELLKVVNFLIVSHLCSNNLNYKIITHYLPKILLLSSMMAAKSSDAFQKIKIIITLNTIIM